MAETPKDAEAATSEEPELNLRKNFPRAIARVLDDLFTIPKTNIRVGLDPILGFFFLFVGDALSAIMGTSILLEGARRQLPKSVLIRMATNIGLNATLGSIPIIGDLFSIWFRSNAQNNALLERHSGNLDQPKVRPSFWPIFLFLAFIILIIALIFLGIYWGVRSLIH